jgi:hypothetical protein
MQRCIGAIACNILMDVNLFAMYNLDTLGKLGYIGVAAVSANKHRSFFVNIEGYNNAALAKSFLLNPSPLPLNGDG